MRGPVFCQLELHKDKPPPPLAFPPPSSPPPFSFHLHQADPNYKLLAKAYPYMAKRLLTDPAPELRESFEDLILKVVACART